MFGAVRPLSHLAIGKMQVIVVPSPATESIEHLAAVQFDEAFDDREAKSDPSMTRVDRVRMEAVEDMRDQVVRNAAALIRYLEHDVVVAAQRRQRHGLAGRREADRIRQEIEQDLAHPLRVGKERPDVRQDDDLKVQARFRPA